MFGSSQGRERGSDRSMWLAETPQRRQDPVRTQEAQAPPQEGLIRSLSSRLFRAVPWASPRRSHILPTHDTPKEQEPKRLEAPQREAVQPPQRVFGPPPPSTLPAPRATPDRAALFARAASPSSARSRGQLTPLRARPNAVHEPSPLSGSVSMGSFASPDRSRWSTLQLGPAPSSPLSAHKSVQTGAAPRSTPRALPPVPHTKPALGRTPLASPAKRVAKPAPLPHSASHASVLGKRQPTHEEAPPDEPADSPSARKRRMVWDPEMGFVDADELEARHPPPPPPQNEAERILRALESMRTPLGDARREGMARSQSAPLWQRSSISVPEPSLDRASLHTASARSPMRSMAPHSRSMQRAQQLRRTQMGQRPSMRSKLRHTVQADDELDVSASEEEDQVAHEVLGARDDDVMLEEELEVPVRRSARRAAKAQRASPAPEKKRRTKQPSPSPEPVPEKKREAKQPSPERAPAPVAADPAPQKGTFAVRAEDDPERKRSVLRQGAAKQNRKHAPSGRITAFDDDDDDDDLPKPEELEKIKLPTELFPASFTFGKDRAAQPTAPTPSKPQSTLLNRLDAPAASTTPSKPPPASGLFGAKPAEPAPKPASSFFAAPPAAPSSLQTEKNGGPIPTFFGKPAEPAPAAGLGLANAEFGAAKPEAPKQPAFSFGAKPATPTEPVASAFGRAAAAPHDNGPKEEPASLFGSAPSNDQPSALSHAKTDNAASTAPPTAPDAEPATGFSFSTPSTGSAPAAPTGFSFGTPQPAPEKSVVDEKPAASDPAEKPPPTLSFGAAAPAPSGFSFSAPKEPEAPASAPRSKLGLPLFGAPQNTDATSTPTFGFGAPPHDTAEKKRSRDEEAPATKRSAPSLNPSASAFSFGKPAETDRGSPAPFAFGSPSTAPAPGQEAKETQPNHTPFSGATTSSEQKPAAPEAKPAPTFSFGGTTPAPTSTPAAPAASTPSFSFGKTGASAPSFAFGSTPASAAPSPAAPSFSFGGAAAAPAPAATPFVFGSGPNSAASSAAPSAVPSPVPSTTPTFAFGGAPSASAAAPTFAFGGAPSAPSTAPGSPFAFGTNSPGPSAPTPGFGSGGAPTQPTPAPFAFGAGTNSTPASPGPFGFGTPQAPAAPEAGMFNMGTSPAPSGRQIKPLRQPRRR